MEAVRGSVWSFAVTPFNSADAPTSAAPKLPASAGVFFEWYDKERQSFWPTRYQSAAFS